MERKNKHNRTGIGETWHLHLFRARFLTCAITLTDSDADYPWLTYTFSLYRHIYEHTPAVTHKHTGTTTAGTSSWKKRVTMAESSNWLWTAASAKYLVLSETCHRLASVSLIFLCGAERCYLPYCCHMLQWFLQPFLPQLIILLSEPRQHGMARFYLMKILDCTTSRVKDWNRETPRAKQQWLGKKNKKKTGRHRHSKKLINTNCLSNTNIRAQRAFHLKSNDAAAWSDAKLRDFPFSDNLFCEETHSLSAFQLMS